jgi:thioredoxin
MDTSFATKGQDMVRQSIRREWRLSRRSPRRLSVSGDSRAKSPWPRSGRPSPGYSGNVFDVTDDTFEQDVLHADVPVVLDFWAPWCGPCRAVEPILQQLEEETGGRVEFARINIDEHPLTAVRYDVLSIPTAILFDRGEQKATLIGARPRSHYERVLAEVLPAA